MVVETIDNRLKDIAKRKETVIAQFNALLGAEAELNELRKIIMSEDNANECTETESN